MEGGQGNKVQWKEVKILKVNGRRSRYLRSMEGGQDIKGQWKEVKILKVNERRSRY